MIAPKIRKSDLETFNIHIKPLINNNMWSGSVYIEGIFYLNFRTSHPEVFLRKGILKIYSTFTGEDPCRSVILTKLQSNSENKNFT